MSNTMEADFCIEAQQEAFVHYGARELFNTDQSSKPVAGSSWPGAAGRWILGPPERL